MRKRAAVEVERAAVKLPRAVPGALAKGAGARAAAVPSQRPRPLPAVLPQKRLASPGTAVDAVEKPGRGQQQGQRRAAERRRQAQQQQQRQDHSSLHPAVEV